MAFPVIVCIEKKDRPVNMPDYQTLVNRGFTELPRQTTATNNSGVRLDLDNKSGLGVASVWLKFGNNITMGEARTQDFVAQYLEAHNVAAVRAPRVYLAFTCGALGFIVTEFIDGKTCDNDDAGLVAAAVQSLIGIQSPSATPGPYGGGLIEHPFFIDRKSSIAYSSVEQLNAHVNGILSETRTGGSVDLVAEVATHGLRLCVSDIVHPNFIKDADGRIVAVDFGGYSFLPPSFFALALSHESSSFALRVAPMLDYPLPPSPQLKALSSASYAMVPFGTNAVGLPKSH